MQNIPWEAQAFPAPLRASDRVAGAPADLAVMALR